MKTIGIIGSRRRDSEEDFKKCEEAFLSVYEPGDEIVSGGCPKGGDKFAEILAKKHQVTIKIYYAQWNKIGRGAGFARNTYIAKDSDVLIACVSYDRKGGTENTIKTFLKTKSAEMLLLPTLPDDPDGDSELFSI